MSPAAKFDPNEEEQVVLQAAVQVIRESSILDFKMSELAAAAGISMGSVYKHVQSKDDVMIALVSHSLGHSLSNFRKILELPLSMPERCIATVLPDYTICGLHPFDEPLHMLVKNGAILSRGSSKWVNRMLRTERQIADRFYQAFKAAYESGELRGDDKDAVLNQLNLGLWALGVGFSQINLLNGEFEIYSEDRDQSQLHGSLSVQVQCVKAFINSFDWKKPLDQEGIQRVYRELERMGFRKP